MAASLVPSLHTASGTRYTRTRQSETNAFGTSSALSESANVQPQRQSNIPTDIRNSASQVDFEKALAQIQCSPLQSGPAPATLPSPASPISPGIPISQHRYLCTLPTINCLSNCLLYLFLPAPGSCLGSCLCACSCSGSGSASLCPPTNYEPPSSCPNPILSPLLFFLQRRQPPPPADIPVSMRCDAMICDELPNAACQKLLNPTPLRSHRRGRGRG